MTKIKKYGLVSLIINLILTIGGGVGFIFALKAMKDFEWTGPDMSEYGEMSLLIIGLAGAAMMIAILVPLVNLVLGGINSLMMLLQVLTGKRGFSVLPILLSVILVLFNGLFVLGGIFFFIPLVALSLGSIVLNIKSLEKSKEAE